MTRLKFTAIFGALLFAAPAFHSLVFAAGPTTRPAPPPATQPATYIVKKGALPLDLQLDGVFQPADAFEARFKMKSYSGPLTIVKAAAPFAAVKKGDVLIECDPQHMNWSLQGAENELTVARAALKKAQADSELSAKGDALALRIQQDAVKNAEAGLSWWEKVDGPQSLLSADLMLKQVRHMVEDQTDELNELKKMYAGKDLTTDTADIVIKRAVRRLEIAKAQEKMQEQRNEKFKANEYPISKQHVLDGVEQVRQALAALQNTQAQAEVLRKTALSNARIALQQAEQKYNDIKADAAALTITAPFDGIVIYGNIADGAWQGGDPKAFKAGERLTAGQIVMRLMHPGRLQIETTVPENRALWIDSSCKAQVTPAALPSISYGVDCPPLVMAPRGNPPQFGFTLTVSIPQADPRLLPGMKASVKVQGRKGEQVLLVPASAISGNTVKLRNADGTFVDHAVTTGRSDGQTVEIRSGLNEGDQILLTSDK